MAEVLPFPLNRRKDLIERQANRFLDLGPRSCETTLAAQLHIQREALLRKGVEPNAVERQVQALEGAVRARVWALVLTPEVGR
jgi:hypothetical protein